MRIKDLKQLWQAARDGDLNTLPEQVTKEDLQYEDEVIMIIFSICSKFYLFACHPFITIDD